MSMANDPAPGTPPNPAQDQAAPAPSPSTQVATAPTSVPSKAESPQDELIGSWLAAHLHRVDGTYQVLVLALTFLIGSFAATNADVWLNLATGRLLAQGKYEFGVDPFSYTTEASDNRPATPWINRSWLFSWISYLLYDGDSGTVLVIFKALLGSGLAALLLFLRPGGSYRWVVLPCALLAILALAPALQLQSVVVSFLFLAITLFILHRAGVLAGPEDSASPGLLWILPALFALWINLDAWFVLGPLTLLVCLAMLPLEKSLKNTSRVPPGTLAAVLGVGVLACLANPHHVHALFTLPSELSYLFLKVGNFWPEGMVTSGRLLYELQTVEPNFSQLLSPLSQVYLGNTSLGLTVSGISYFILLLIVVLSFYFAARSQKGLSGPRLLVVRAGLVLPFAILSLLNIRLIPFFAIVGGVVAILNWQEYLVWRGSRSVDKAEEQNLWGNLARLCCGFLLFGLFFLTWPGWINHAWGDFSSPRRVAWAVEADPSLKSAAEFVGRMQGESKLGRGLNLTVDIADYCTWFAPGVKYFLDDRFELFGARMAEFNSIRRSLTEEAANVDPSKRIRDSWRPAFAKYQIDHVAGAGLQEKLRDTRTRRLLAWAWRDPREFNAVYVDGKTLVAAWKKAEKSKDAIPAIAEIWRHEAFGTSSAARYPSREELTPLEEDPGFWRLYAFGQKRPSLQTQQADIYLEYFNFRTQEMGWRLAHLSARLVASALLPAGVATGPMVQDAVVYSPPLSHPLYLQQIFGQDRGPPEALILALRTVREAQAEDPQNPRCYGILAQACNLESIQEGHWVQTNVSNLRVNIRRLQVIGALKQYLMLQPQDADVHWMLGNIFVDQNYLDAGLEHVQAAIQQLQKIKSGSQQFLQERKAREERMMRLESEVASRLADFDRVTASESDLRKVRVAIAEPYRFKRNDKEMVDPRGMGLVAKARQILDNVNLATLSDQEKQEMVYLRLKLALQTGNLWEVARALPIFQPTATSTPMAPATYWELTLFLSAAIGDYAEADKALQEMEKNDQTFQQRVTFEALKSNIVNPAAVMGLPPGAPRWTMLAFHLPFQSGQLMIPQNHPAWQPPAHEVLHNIVTDRAEKTLVRGLFALEMGDTGKALAFFEAALGMLGPNTNFADRKLAERWRDILRTESAQARKKPN